MGQRCVPCVHYTVFSCMQSCFQWFRITPLALLGPQVYQHRYDSYVELGSGTDCLVVEFIPLSGIYPPFAQSLASPDAARSQIDHLKMDKVNKNGLRGVVATKDFKAGEVLAHIPAKCTIDVGPYTMPGAVRGNL